MSISISPTDSYRVFQRDLSSGNPPGSTTTYDKGWGEVDLQVASDTSSPVSYQIVDAENPSRVIQDWTATGQQAAAGTSVIKLQIPASQDCYIVKLAPTADLSSAASSTPFFMGNVDAAAGQSKATVMFSSYAYGATDPAAQPEQYVPFSFSSRVYSAVTNDPTSSTPESWLPPGNVNTPGGAVQTTFAAEYLADRQAELGVACALVGLDVPGSSVNNWEPGSSAYFYLAATLERAGGKISNFIWNQGDSDWNTAGAATYQQKFETLTNALDQVVTGSYRVIGFDYSWVGGSQPDRFITEVDQAKAAVADAHGGSFVEGVSAGDDYVGGHPSMQSRLLAADDLFRQILSLDNPDADKGPSLTGLGFLEGNTVTIRVSEDKGSNLIGQVIQFGSPEVTYRTATPEELSSQFSVYYRDFTDAAHRIPVLSAEILSSTEIRLTLSSQPSGPVDVWYRADYDGGTGNPNAVIRDDDTSDGIVYGHGLQTRLTPIQVSYQPSNGQSPPSPTMDTLGGSQVPNSVTIPGSTATNPGTGTTGATIPPQVSVPVPSPTSPSSSPVLEIDVSEDAWQGDAQFSVTVDGQQVGGIYTASASHGLGQTQAITIPTSLSAGSHALSISFLNDAYGGSADADRNLYVDGVKVDGTAIANGSATEMSDGAASFTLTVPAGSASSTIPGSTATNPGTGTTGATTPPQVSVPVPSPTSPSSSPVLEIDVSEDAWQGDAQFSVTVDGQQVGGIYTASASHGLGQTQAITIPTSLSAGSHALSISFLNDAYGGSADADRNLYVDGVKVDGTAIANGSATEMSDGAASFTLTVPAGSASSTIPGSTATNPGTGTTGATTPPQVSVPVPSPTSPSSSPVLEIDVSEDAWQGDAQFSVTVDGQQVGGIYTASASHGLGQTQAITIPTSLSAGSHALSISFLNDAYGGSADADRNLYVDGVKVDGTAIANGSATEMSDGAASFTLTVPAGSASSTIPGSTATNPGTGTTGATTPPQVSVPVPSPTSPSSSPVLEIDVSEDAWQGDAQFSVTVDGQQVGGIYTASASHGLGQTQAITIPTSLSAGSHALSISFLNDAYGGSADADRNLYVDGVKVDGTAIANGSATEMSDGAASFTLTVPAGSASSTIPGSTATNPGTGTTGATIPPQVSVPVPSPTSPSSSPVLEIDVSEDAWQGDAQFSVTVDGQQVGGIYTASASHGLGQTQAITIPTSLSAGSHALSISFLNDAYGGSADADRNLYVDGVKVDGTAIANGSATEMSDGAASFTLTVPAGSASSTIPGSTATNPGTGTTGATTPPQQLLPQPDVSGAGLLTSPAIVDPQSSRILTVGQGKQYTTIAEAVAASQDGDFIQVDAGTYTNDFLQTTTRLTIVGVGGMVNMVATELCPNGKAILTVDNDLTLANFTFTGAKVTDGNGAGIRYESGTLNLINDGFYGNQNGILGGVTNGTVSIRNSLFSGNGSGTGYTHNLYIGQSAQLTVTDSIFENASVGHELKSRALINVITNSIFRDGPTGTASYDIDLPDGGNATIKNNLIEKGPLASNNAMIHFGGEGLPYPSSSLTIIGNSFVNDKGSSTVAVRNETLAVSTITENTFVNLLASQLSSGAANLTDNQDGRGSPIQDSTANSFPSATSIMFTDTASHSVVLDGSPLLNVAGGSGHLDVIAQAGRTLTIGGSGGLNFSEQGTSGANQITTKAGTTNTLNLIGEDIVASNGDDTITTGDESVTGSISGAAHIESGTGYDHWAVTGELSLHINGGAPNITLSSNASALITGVASGLNLTSDGGTVSVDITQEGGELAGEHISFSIASGSTSASVYNGGTGIATASGLQGASIRLGDGVEQVTSNGTDEIWAGTGADTVIVSGVNTIVHGGAGVLSVFGRGIPAGDDAKVYAQGGTINIDGDSGHIIYFGGDQANSVNADLSNISLLGGAGLMTIHNQAYSENINGGSGGIDYKAVGSASGSITTALGSINLIDLGDNPDIIVDSWGTDTITGGSGTLTVHGNAIISGASGSRTLTLMGSDVLNGVGHDTVNVTQGANVTYNIGQSGTLTETSATVRASVLGSAAGSATVVGGSALLLGDTQTGLMISTGNTGNALVELNAGDARVETGSADTIQAFGQQATIDIMSSNVRVVSGDGTIRLASQGYNYTGLQFAAGSGKAELLLADGGGDSITFGAGLTSVSVSGGQGNNFSFFAGQGGGSNEITGFRAGTDQILLHGVVVASEQTTGGSLSVTLSDQSQLQLIGLTSDHGVFA